MVALCGNSKTLELKLFQHYNQKQQYFTPLCNDITIMCIDLIILRLYYQVFLNFLLLPAVTAHSVVGQFLIYIHLFLWKIIYLLVSFLSKSHHVWHLSTVPSLDSLRTEYSSGKCSVATDALLLLVTFIQHRLHGNVWCWCLAWGRVVAMGTSVNSTVLNGTLLDRSKLYNTYLIPSILMS